MSYPVIEELQPRPDCDDDDWQGVEAFSIPGSNSIVLAWVAEGGQHCWSAVEDCSDFCDNGFSDDRDSAIFSGTMVGMKRVSERIAQAYNKRLLIGKGEK